MVEETKRHLLEREDTDGNFQITIDDDGPKVSYCQCIGKMKRLTSSGRQYHWAPWVLEVIGVSPSLAHMPCQVFSWS